MAGIPKFLFSATGANGTNEGTMQSVAARPKPSLKNTLSPSWYIPAGVALLLGTLLTFLPSILTWTTHYEAERLRPFPVTVDPKAEIIIEDPEVEAMFARQNSGVTAAAITTADILHNVAGLIASASWYQMLAAADASRVVVVDPGYRKEQVALAFSRALSWDTATQHAFLTKADDSPPYLAEGVFAPGVYVVSPNTSPNDVHERISARFEEQVLARYATSTEEKVPLAEALTIASMIERETSDKDEMRMISGIMWNRIFTGMRLQIDSTLQYAKATGKGKNGWWPAVRPRDKYITSPYNTYQNQGLPPAPISNPSVAAVLAALNPKKTDCLFYFHDDFGGFHCSKDYGEHVALLKKYYGQGK